MFSLDILSHRMSDRAISHQLRGSPPRFVVLHRSFSAKDRSACPKADCIVFRFAQTKVGV